jgi:hypothetical protein
VGSDHFPVFIALCLDPAAAATQTALVPEKDDKDEADEAIEGEPRGRGRRRDRD